jgi:hypothetical protein
VCRFQDQCDAKRHNFRVSPADGAPFGLDERMDFDTPANRLRIPTFKEEFDHVTA